MPALKAELRKRDRMQGAGPPEQPPTKAASHIDLIRATFGEQVPA